MKKKDAPEAPGAPAVSGGESSGGKPRGAAKRSDPVIAACRLCLEVREIQNSHILPKWVYRRAVDCNEPGSPISQPIRLDGLTAVAINKQAQEHLLCEDCEQLFGVWDDYAGRVSRQGNGSFPALEQALIGPAAPPGGLRPGMSPSLDRQRLARFICSVIWRASITSHEDFAGISLGGFDEGLRRYLLGEGHFLANARLVLKLLAPPEGGVADRLAWGPIVRWEQGVPGVGLVVFGIDAAVWFGPSGGSILDETCYVRTGRIFVSDGEEMVEALQKLAAARPVGSLARLAAKDVDG